MKVFVRIALLLLLVVIPGVVVAQAFRVEGRVHDSTGAVINGAHVFIHSGTFQASTETDATGRFQFRDVPGASGTLEVSADGFDKANQSWSVNSSGVAVADFSLTLPTANERVIVSATKTEMRLSEAPGSTVLLSQSDLASTPALTVDDALRQVPGFSLFRRSGSRTANPTSLGVSLRGLGASGPSRALVLDDGIPMTDPFGSWVYWDRIPRAELASAEIFRGGASDLYGSSALGGVIQFLSRQPSVPAFTLEMSYGNEQTPSLSAWAGTKIGPWDMYAATDMFRSDGYIIVPSGIRGSVDTPANERHGTLDFGGGHQLGSDGRIFIRGNLFDEARHNGTFLQTNDTHIAEGAAGFEKQIGSAGSFSALVFQDVQSYNQTFSSVAADRNSESLVNLQHVPAQKTGGNVQWTRALGSRQTLLAGAELNETLGWSDEQTFNSGTHLANTIAGGRQRTLGVFGEDIFRIDRWTVILGARIDHWQNFDAASFRTPISTAGPTSANIFPDQTETAFNPRLSVLRPITNNVSATTSVYRAFRAPTLNELYRGFRLGNVSTLANSALVAERLTGAEAGLNASGFDHKLDLRGTFFWSDIVDPVSNVTLSTTPTLITRQRQNLGRTRSRGVELEGVAHLNSRIEFSAGYDFTGATVLNFPANTGLEGLEIPQVPRNQFTWTARYWNPSSWMASVQGRFVGVQFDDDQNQLPLARYYTMDLTIGRSLTHGVQIFGAAENLLNQRYEIARTPTPNIGPPILVRIGLRYNFPEGK